MNSIAINPAFIRQAVASARPEGMERRPGYGGWWRLSSARPRHGAPRGKRPRTVPRLRPDGGRHAARGVARGADRVRRGRVPEPVRRTAGSLARAAGRACGGPAGPRRLGRCVLRPPRPRPASADLLSAGGRGRHADLDRRAAHARGGWTGPLLAHRFRPAETSGPPAFRHDARQRRAGRGAAARRGAGELLSLIEVAGPDGQPPPPGPVAAIVDEALSAALRPDSVAGALAPGRYGVVSHSGTEADLAALGGQIRDAMREAGLQATVGTRSVPLRADGLTP